MVISTSEDAVTLHQSSAAADLPQATWQAGALTSRQAFAEVLRQESELKTPQLPATGDSETVREAQADKAAGDLISNALILPMLKQLRRSPWSENTVFAPGIGEKTFGPQFDMQISDRIAHNPRLGLKAALAQRLMKRGSARIAANGDAGAAPAADTRLRIHG